jgi:hypothetical protein
MPRKIFILTILTIVICLSGFLLYQKLIPEPDPPYIPRTITFMVNQDINFVVLLNNTKLPVAIREITERDKVYISFTVSNLQRCDKLKVIDFDSAEILFFGIDFTAYNEAAKI